MNHDVDDTLFDANDGDETLLREQPMGVPKTADDPRPQTTTNSTKIFSQLRSFSTNISVNSLGSLFSPTAMGPIEDGTTPTPTRSSSPQRRGFKSIFTHLGGARRQPVRITIAPTQQDPRAFELEGDKTPHYEMLASPLGSEFADDYARAPMSALSASVSYESSAPDDTPPLTPESLVTDIASLSSGSQNAQLGYDDYAYEFEYDDDGAQDDDAYVPDARPHSLEIKEGKKPARPIDFDALLEDISSDPPAAEGAAADDTDEWYGLEYTLELSTRERRASETQVVSAGEHSKSRESWAAIHQGTMHPFFEDEEYYQWKNWHRYLERQDEKRRHRRGRAFKAHAKELAWVYADEMHTRDLIAWQMEVYGDIEKGLYERLGRLEAHRPDPYHPPQKHGVGWSLKRSRSVASLRELRALPEPMFPLPKRVLSKT